MKSIRELKEAIKQNVRFVVLDEKGNLQLLKKFDIPVSDDLIDDDCAVLEPSFVLGLLGEQEKQLQELDIVEWLDKNHPKKKWFLYGANLETLLTIFRNQILGVDEK